MTTTADRLIGTIQDRLRELGIALETESPESPLDASIDAIVTLSHAEAAARYAVVKAPMTLNSLVSRALSRPPYPLLIIGDRITRRSAAAFRDADIQFVDTLGNAFIKFGSVRVDVQGRTEPAARTSESDYPLARPKRPANIFSPRRSQVILALLTWPELSSANIREIANAAGVSVGQAHDALTQLDQAGFLITASKRLDRTDDLLDYWTAAYPAGLGRRLNVAEYHGDPLTPVRRPRAEQPVYLSSESAEGTDIARPATLTVYLDILDPRLPIMNRWSSSPDHPPNIFVRHKFWASPRPDEERPSATTQNAPWPLVYADLVATGDARLGEVARTWRTRCARSDEV